MNSRSEKYRNIDRQFLWHPYTSHSAIQKNDFPVIVRGKGPYLFDCAGQRWFDAISSWWCCNLGHSHPRLVKAIKTQADKLQHSILGNMSHPPAIELAEKLAVLFPDKRRRIFFSSDGSSAVEAALKIAVQYWHNIGKPKRCRLVSMEGDYHGDTLGAVSAGYLPGFHRPFRSLLFPVYRAAAPDCGNCSHSLQTNSKYMNFIKVGPHSLCGRGGTRLSRPTIGTSCQSPNSCDCECFKSMKKIVEKHTGTIAAVIIEPLCQCAAGMRIYPPTYLKKLSQLCRAHKILLIADEIAVGFGRTGTMFAFEQAGIDPDIVCLGKSLAGGYLPISAAVVKENIYAAFSDSSPFAKATGDSAKMPRGLPLGASPTDHTFYHGHTFAGNPIACAAALEVLKIYDEEKIVLTARRKGRMMAKKMAALQSVTGIKNVRSLGMISAVELAKGGRLQAQTVKRLLWQQGILVRPLGNVIYLMPPLNTPEILLVRTIDLLGKALEDVK